MEKLFWYGMFATPFVGMALGLIPAFVYGLD